MARPRKNPLPATAEKVDTQTQRSEGFPLSEEEVALIQAKRKGESVTPPEVEGPKVVKDIPIETNKKLKSIPLKDRADYIQWHREAHIPETHAQWCLENNVPFVRINFNA